MKKSVATNLRAAAESLTKETWVQGAYFRARNGKVCMCAHGAVQRVINPRVRGVLAENEAHAAAEAAWATSRASAGRAERAAQAATVAASPAGPSADAAQAAVNKALVEDSAEAGGRRRVWTKRPTWAIPEHYVCGMVGLTAAWNDTSGRTVEDVKAKLEEAALVAEKLGL